MSTLQTYQVIKEVIGFMVILLVLLYEIPTGTVCFPLTDLLFLQTT